MIKFEKPVNFNGTELLQQLNAGGVKITEAPMVDGEGDLWLQIAEADKVKALAIITNHNGTIIPKELTVTEKLAKAGLSLDELKTALGL
jgi:hypothetical protein